MSATLRGGDAPAEAKEWWEVDDEEEEYVPLKKRRDQRVTAGAEARIKPFYHHVKPFYRSTVLPIK